MTGLVQKLWAAAERHPDAPAILAQDTISYGELREHVGAAAAGLRAMGVSPGDRVAYQLRNGAAAPVTFFATLATGAVAVPVNPALTPAEVRLIRGRCRPALFVSEQPFDDAGIVVSDPGDPNPFRAAGTLAELVDVDVDDPAALFFSSGTTGEPKGIRLSHGNLGSNAEWVARESLDGVRWGPGFVAAAVLPLSHSFGLTCAQNAALLSGAALAPLVSFTGEAFLALIRRFGVTTAPLVPSAAQALLDAWERDPGPLPLRYAMVGGAPIPTELVEALESKLGVAVLEGYGLTETSPVCAFRTPNTPRKAGSVGRAAGHAELAVLTPGGAVERAGEGELLVSGPGVALGTLDSPDERTGGWLHTGDIGRIDDGGHVFVIDRKKDLIIRHGYNVSPAEVEGVIAAVPGVRDAAVAGLPDPKGGETVAAFVVAGDGVTERAVREACEARLAGYKRPGVVSFVEDIPRGAKGQVLRHRLRPQS